MIAQQEDLFGQIQIRDTRVVDAQEALRRQERLELGEGVIGSVLALRSLDVNSFVPGDNADNVGDPDQTDGIISPNGKAARALPRPALVNPSRALSSGRRGTRSA